MSRQMKTPPAKAKTRETRSILARSPTDAERAALADAVRYLGSPYHKRDPGEFKLTPPASPRPDKSLCDHTHVRTPEEALRLLRKGATQGLWDHARRGDYPSVVWCVEGGTVYEAQLGNKGLGEYHGYPLLNGEAYRRKVLETHRSFNPDA